MPARPSPAAPRLIKRYDNRKLYDPSARRYVSIEDIARLITAGEDVFVQDQKSGEDITSVVLAQVILDGVKERAGSIPPGAHAAHPAGRGAGGGLGGVGRSPRSSGAGTGGGGADRRRHRGLRAAPGGGSSRHGGEPPAPVAAATKTYEAQEAGTAEGRDT